MLPRIKVNSLQGISYKNITIKLKSGVYKYNLASQTDLGLPENAFVYGIMIRKVDKFSKSINNRPLIEDNILNSTYLTLLDIVPKAILKEYPLKQATTEDMIIYFEPKKRNEIDWSRSSINIFNATNQAALTSDMDFEFIVLYYDPSIDCKITSNILDVIILSCQKILFKECYNIGNPSNFINLLTLYFLSKIMINQRNPIFV